MVHWILIELFVRFHGRNGDHKRLIGNREAHDVFLCFQKFDNFIMSTYEKLSRESTNDVSKSNFPFHHNSLCKIM